MFQSNHWNNYLWCLLRHAESYSYSAVHEVISGGAVKCTSLQLFGLWVEQILTSLQGALREMEPLKNLSCGRAKIKMDKWVGVQQVLYSSWLSCHAPQSKKCLHLQNRVLLKVTWPEYNSCNSALCVRLLCLLLQWWHTTSCNKHSDWIRVKWINTSQCYRNKVHAFYSDYIKSIFCGSDEQK